MAAESASGRPFTTFNFSVELRVKDISPRVCDAQFSECDGLEITLEAKTIKEGGNNNHLHRAAGQMGYGTLTLKRGMTGSFDLWTWFARTAENPSLRADGEVVVLAQDGVTERVRFLLQRCLPVKIKAPSLNARDGAVAIEELQLVYETLTVQVPEGSRA